MNEPDQLTPQQRLAISRRAIVDQLQTGGAPERLAYTGRPNRAGLLDRFSWGPVLRSVARRWWQRHPANAAGQLARPLLDHYARTQPVKLMAAAAALGAVAVLVKPWRLLSITAVLAAVMKTSDAADIVTTLMQKATQPRKDS